MELRQVAVLIPAYKPDVRMNALIRDLRARGFDRIVVVDDGGGASYAERFAEAQSDGARVLWHDVNRGKGAALKTGLSYLLQTGACPVVTCDADGQHDPADIERIARALLDAPEALVLGVRRKRDMPLRSKIGNGMTCALLGLLTGLWIQDTQTGLRGIPASALPAHCALTGERYEYEMNVLLETRAEQRQVVQLPISTLYFDQNEASHFHPIRDGLRIYGLMFRQLGKFMGSSMIAGALDLALFTILHYTLPAEFRYLHTSDRFVASILAFLLPESLGVPALIARAASSFLNYMINRKLVFRSKAGKRSVFLFYLVVLFVLLASIQVLRLLTMLGLPAVPAKILADALLFTISYSLQQRVIFRR